MDTKFYTKKLHWYSIKKSEQAVKYANIKKKFVNYEVQLYKQRLYTIWYIYVNLGCL